MAMAMPSRWRSRISARWSLALPSGRNRRPHMRCSKGMAGSRFLPMFMRPDRGTSLPRERRERPHIFASEMAGRRSLLGAMSEGTCLRSRTLRDGSCLRSRNTVRTAHRGQTKDMPPSSRVIATSRRVVVGPTRRMAPHVGLLQRTTMASIIRRLERLYSKNATHTPVRKLLHHLRAPLRTGPPFAWGVLRAPVRVRRQGDLCNQIATTPPSRYG